MENKIVQIRRDLKALRQNSKAMKRLIELQGIYYKRINALEKEPRTVETEKAIKRQKELLEKLGIKEFANMCAETEEKYMDAINKLEPIDRAMLLDSCLNGMQNWQLGNKYGFTENGARKHIALIIERLAKKL